MAMSENRLLNYLLITNGEVEMTIYAVVETLEAGYDCEEDMVKSLGFKVGDKFEVDYIGIGGSSTSIQLKEFPNQSFNSVFFEFKEDGKELDIFDDKRFNPYLSKYY